MGELTPETTRVNILLVELPFRSDMHRLLSRADFRVKTLLQPLILPFLKHGDRLSLRVKKLAADSKR